MRRFQDFCRPVLGGVYSLAGLALGRALFVYNAEEPSWNTSVETLQGSAFLLGNTLADFLIQFFGLASSLWPLAFLLVGFKKMRGVLSLKGAFSGTLVSVLLLSLALGNFHASFWSAPLGGSFGTLAWCASVPFLPAPLLIALAGGLGIFLFMEATRLSFSPSLLLRIFRKNRSPKGTPLSDSWSNFSEAFSLVSLTDKEPSAGHSPEMGGARPLEPAEPVTSRKQGGALNLAMPEGYTLPSLELLALPHEREEPISAAAAAANAEHLMHVLNDFGIKGEIVETRSGPVVTLYELHPAAGIKSSRVIGLANDIARSMSAVSARVAVVPGKNVIGIELPNAKRQTVYLRELLASPAYEQFPGSLALALGKNIGGAPIVVDLARMPHLLVAGTTGSGKSVSINTMILSLVYRLSPAQCRFIMVDPKMLELSVYDGIPHLLTPVVTDPKKAVVALKWTVREMENRYKAMARLGVRNIEGYNARLTEAQNNEEPLLRRVQTGFDPESGLPIHENQPLDLAPLPYIVVIVDEMADLMLVAGKDIENAVQRLAQMARAAGIHLIMATQRPSVDVITGTIKANFPTRVSFHVTSRIDSRTILGEQGAEQLLGQGDMLYMTTGGQIVRVHGPFVSDREVETVVNELKEQGEPQYTPEIVQDGEDDPEDIFDSAESDPLFEEALAVVRREGKVSTSFIQRHLQIGYNRAARIVDQMEERGFVSAANRVGKREILG
ncbi:MAG: DNA translocase FtsK 4TM domain-containing protein [Holosporales bacterium]|jgi:S-DNA-T family DNA segregation ATPase FtsK/SpoIIIE|nr:DNA translocase FtsK 4TM domain-containing protein [Holosporales bacterium]